MTDSPTTAPDALAKALASCREYYAREIREIANLITEDIRTCPEMDPMIALRARLLDHVAVRFAWRARLVLLCSDFTDVATSEMETVIRMPPVPWCAMAFHVMEKDVLQLLGVQLVREGAGLSTSAASAASARTIDSFIAQSESAGSSVPIGATIDPKGDNSSLKPKL